jgi:hypothetical protein
VLIPDGDDHRRAESELTWNNDHRATGDARAGTVGMVRNRGVPDTRIHPMPGPRMLSIANIERVTVSHLVKDVSLGMI